MTASMAESWGSADTTEPSDDDLYHPRTVGNVAILSVALGIIYALVIIVALLFIKTRTPDVRTSAAPVDLYSQRSNVGLHTRSWSRAISHGRSSGRHGTSARG